MRVNRDDRVRELVGTASIRMSDRWQADVLARVAIPMRRLDWPKIVLKPTAELFDFLSHAPNGTLSFNLKVGSEQQCIEVEVDVLWMLRANRTFWSVDVQECTVDTDARGIWVREHYSGGDSSAKFFLKFWLSTNKHLHPFSSVEVDYLGNRKVQVLNQKCAELPGGNRLRFAKDYFWWSESSIEAATDSLLVAVGEWSGGVDEMPAVCERMVADLDEFLLLVSLATRTRTACFGWEAAGSAGVCSRYLPNRSIPTGFSLSSINDGLIDGADHEEFFQSAYARLVNSPYRSSVTSAVFALVPASERILESDFIANFAALEEVLLQYRRRVGLEFALPGESWDVAKKGLRSAIRQLVSDGTARAKIYSKLDELNRIAIGDSYRDFIAEIGVEASDLWPVFDKSRGVSLYQVRNWLAHGEAIPQEARDCLWVAREHLRWVLERVVLKLLSWPVERSEVAPALLKVHAVAMRDFDDARAVISRAMLSGSGHASVAGEDAEG